MPQRSNCMIEDDVLEHARQSLKKGEPEQTVRLCRQMLMHNPDQTDALLLLALAARRRRDRPAARQALERLAVLMPGSAEVHNDLGLLHLQDNRIARAVDCFTRALALAPQMGAAHYNLGLAYKAAGNGEAARHCFEATLGLIPEHAKAHFSLGELLHSAGCPAEAVAWFRQAVRIDPDYVAAWNHLAICLGQIGRTGEALHHLEQAARIDPQSAETLCNLGNACRRAGRFDASLAQYRRAIALKPDLEAAHFNMALVLLLQGDYAQGWSEYEWRLRRFAPDSGYPRRFGLPLWQGENLSGKAVLVYDEQGFGDVFMFARYLDLLRQAGARIVLEVRETLYSLMAGLNRNHEVLIRGSSVRPKTPCDYCIPLASLPLRFNTRLDTIPDIVPYLKADPDRIERWSDSFSPAHLNIGFVWSGSRIDPTRRCDPALFAPFAALAGVKCYSLQIPEEKHIDDVPAGFENLGPLLHDFAETAAVIENLDLVITIDTAIAHLSGALGKPTRILLPHIPDWRWLLERSDSPWYPSVKLYRQELSGRWEPVINRLHDDLQALTATLPRGRDGTFPGAPAPSDRQWFFSRATALQQAGDYPGAQLFYRKVLKLDPACSDAQYNLGLIAYQNGRLRQAGQHFKIALAQRPDCTEAAFALGRALEAGNQREAAAEAYGLALHNDPDHFPSAYNLGVLMLEKNSLQEAGDMLSRAARLEPENWMAHNNLGLALHRAGRRDEAFTAFQNALKLAPDQKIIWQNLGNVHMDRGETAAMLRCYHKAVELAPGDPQAHYQLGKLYQENRFLEQARASFEQAVRLKPDLIEAHLDLGLNLLHCGEYDRGWMEMEWRLRALQRHITIYPFDFAVPRWRGEPLAGKTLLVHAEQGFGDTIQFSRFLADIKGCGGRIIFEVHQPLLRLFERFQGPDEIRAIPEFALPRIDFDRYIPLMSLGLYRDILPAAFPSPVPYLSADPGLTPAWRRRCMPGLRQVGFVWSGNPIQKTNHRRACAAKHFEILADIDGIQWCCLQKQADPESLALLGKCFELDHWAADFGDFADTAAALHNLDLVITTDTAVAHLAGAMGRPVWLLLCYFPDWRWAIDRTDCPWYPTMTLVRQPAPGNWEAVFQNVRKMLLCWKAQHQQSTPGL